MSRHGTTGRRGSGVRPDPRAPLDAELYGAAVALASTPEVQGCTTVSEMIERSGVPRALWYAPPPVVRPTVDASTAQAIAAGVAQVRSSGVSRAAISAATGWSQSAITRFERGDVKPNEVDDVTRWLTDVVGDPGREDTDENA